MMETQDKTPCELDMEGERHYSREVAAAILEGQPLDQIARLITNIVAQRLCVDRVGLFLRDTRGFITPIALRNVSPEYGQAISRLIPAAPILRRSEATGLPVFTRDVQNDSNIDAAKRALYRHENINSILMIMLQYEQHLAGALVVYPEADRLFTPVELAVFQSLADMATLGIAFSQQLQREREFAMLEERNRLAREIHDTVAQSLAALILQLDTTQTLLQRKDLPTTAEMLAQAHGLAKSALEDTRRAIRGLASANAQSLSSAQAIAQEAQQLQAESGIQTQFILTGEEQALTQDQRTSLLRIAQEALNNTRKHARPQRVRVGLQFGGDEVMLLIEDDGMGFDASAVRTPGVEGGYGLFGMEERAQLVGGALHIDSTPGWGTRIRVVMPYRLPASVTENRGSARGEKKPEARKTEQIRTNQRSAEQNRTEQNSIEQNRIEQNRTEETSAEDSFSAADGQQIISSTAIRVLIVDDHTLARQGIRGMLQTSPDVVVVGEATDGGQAVEQALRLQPDVVLMDLQMPGVDGLEGLRRMRARLPNVPVVILTTFQTEQAVMEALAAGARGFLLKDADPAELLAAVRAAQRGETLLSPLVTDHLASLASGQTRAAGAARDPNELNEREREVLQLLAQGARNKEIANALFIAPKTVEYHLSNIFNKLGVSNRTEAARTAVERGLVASGFHPLK